MHLRWLTPAVYWSWSSPSCISSSNRHVHACFCIFVYMPFCLRGHTFFNSKLCVSLWEMALLHDTSMSDFLLIRPNLLLQYVRSELQSLSRCGWHTNWHRMTGLASFSRVCTSSDGVKFHHKKKTLMESWELQQHLSILKHGRTRSNFPYFFFFLSLLVLLPGLSTSKSGPYFFSSLLHVVYVFDLTRHKFKQ
jgi:hypothetical protein